MMSEQEFSGDISVEDGIVEIVCECNVTIIACIETTPDIIKCPNCGMILNTKQKPK